jgi:hypothetical protein
VLPTASLTVAEAFSGPFLLNVPIYQRSYSWDRDEAGQLLEDLIEAAALDDDREPDNSYFLGTILLMDQSGQESARISPKLPSREFDIVDGQQRLVTLMTLMAVLRDLDDDLRSGIGKRVAAMITAQQGSRFFKSERLRLHLSIRDRDFFERHIIAPKSTLGPPPAESRSVSEESLLQARDHFVAELKQRTGAERAALFQFIADRCHVVAILSNDIDRAHRLFVVLNERGKRLQRNDILKADVLSRLAIDRVEWAASAWDTASAKLGDSFEDFFGYVRSIYGYVRPQIISGVRSIVRDQGGAEPFLTNVFLPLAGAYAQVHGASGDDLPAEFRQRLTYLNRLPGGDWIPAAMLILKDWRQDPQRALAQLAAIDRFAHLLRLLCLGNGKRQRRFADVVAALRSDAALEPEHPVFHLSREETRNIAYHMRDLHRRNPKICKLLLLRLSDEIDKVEPSAAPEKFTIEHVLPQRPPATSEWRQWFPSAEERNRCTESLGNLVLIGEKQNDRARNVSFAAKKEIYAKPDPGAPLLATTRHVIACAEWHRFEIEAREEALLKLIEDIWRIDLSTARAGDRDAQRAAVPAKQSVRAGS